MECGSNAFSPPAFLSFNNVVYCPSPFTLNPSALSLLRLPADSRCLAVKQLHSEGPLGRQSQELHQEGTGAGEAFGRSRVCTPGTEESLRYPGPLCCWGKRRQGPHFLLPLPSPSFLFLLSSPPSPFLPFLSSLSSPSFLLPLPSHHSPSGAAD